MKQAPSTSRSTLLGMKNSRNWIVVTDMTCMFASARSFNQPLNNWNVSKVTNMQAMFWGATSFNQPLNNWKVSNVTGTTEAMFENATSFNHALHAPWYVV